MGREGAGVCGGRGPGASAEAPPAVRGLARAGCGARTGRPGSAHLRVAWSGGRRGEAIGFGGGELRNQETPGPLLIFQELRKLIFLFPNHPWNISCDE